MLLIRNEKLENEDFIYSVTITEKKNKLLVKLTMKNISQEIKRIPYSINDKFGLTIKASQNFKNYYQRKHKSKTIIKCPILTKWKLKFKGFIYRKKEDGVFIKPNQEIKRNIVFEKIKNVNEKILLFGHYKRNDILIPIHLGEEFEKNKINTLEKSIEKEGINSKMKVQEDSKWLHLEIELINKNDDTIKIWKSNTSHSGINISYPEKDKIYLKQTNYIGEYGDRIYISSAQYISDIELKKGETLKNSFYFEKIIPIEKNIPIEIGTVAKKTDELEFLKIIFDKYEITKENNQ